MLTLLESEKELLHQQQLNLQKNHLKEVKEIMDKMNERKTSILTGTSSPDLVGSDFFNKMWQKEGSYNHYFLNQDEYFKDFEPVADNFEVQLKQFYSFGRRRTGRSSMLARILVEIALESGRVIKITDHFLSDNRNSIYDIRSKIDKIIHEYMAKGVMITGKRNNAETLQLFLHPESVEIYNSIKIENNPTKFEVFPYDALKKELKKRRRKLLLIN